MLELIDRQPVFAGWNARLKNQVGVALRKTYVPADEVVVAQGSPFKGLYFLVRFVIDLKRLSKNRVLTEYRSLH